MNEPSDVNASVVTGVPPTYGTLADCSAGSDAAAPRSTPPITATGCCASSLLAQASDDSGVPFVVHGTTSMGRRPTPPYVSLTYCAATSAPRRRSGKDPMGASSVLIRPTTIEFAAVDGDGADAAGFDPPVQPAARKAAATVRNTGTGTGPGTRPSGTRPL